MIYGDSIPASGHPPRIPWGGQRAAAARVASHLTGRSEKYRGEWDRYAVGLAEQRGQFPFRQRIGTLL
eukprot:7771680-Pyramimonas_sp.AAC.1